MNKIKVNLKSFGIAVPKYVVHNDELSKLVDTTDEWINSRTGINERRISTTPNENTAGLCTKAFYEIQRKTGINPLDIDVIVVGTITPDSIAPSAACTIQANIGAKNAFAFDVNAACSGFIYALYVGESLLRTGRYKNALVFGADTLSKIMDWDDRATCVLFGDGAGGVLLTASEDEKESFYYTDIHSDGELGKNLQVSHWPLRNPFVKEEEESECTHINMDGRLVFDFASRKAPKSVQTVLEKSGIDISEIKYIIPHQANYRIVEAIAKKLKVDISKFYMNIDKFGNTVAASIPIALCEMHEKGLIEAGDKLIITGFGGGLTWGSTLIEI
ncbi:MAG: ketoacyl-ACP synthase III [Defluviitaleaceae bacterium]|nr:ketoacyl-ACP synthase III [Defluviitaleaceae bacterium]